MSFDWAGMAQPLVFLLSFVGLGWISGKIGRLSAEVTRGLVYLLMRLTLPALIVVSLQRSFSTELLLLSLETLGWSLGFYAVVAVLFSVARPVLPVAEDRKDLLQFVALFGNVGFMGFPVMESLFGRESLFLAAVFNLPFNFIIFTYGVVLLRRGTGQRTGRVGNLREVFLTPVMVSLVVSFLLFVLDLRLPGPVLSFLELLGGITTPLSMITVGIMLARVSIRQSLLQPDLWWMAAARLLFAPTVTLLAGVLIPVRPETLWTAAVLTAMPAAANTPILAVEHNGPQREASQIVLLTSSLVFVTLPAIIIVMSFLFRQPRFL